MKLKDIKVGMKLKTKKFCHNVIVANFNRKCKVLVLEDETYTDDLSVYVQYKDGEEEWVNHKDLKRRKKDKLKAQGE